MRARVQVLTDGEWQTVADTATKGLTIKYGKKTAYPDLSDDQKDAVKSWDNLRNGVKA